MEVDARSAWAFVLVVSLASLQPWLSARCLPLYPVRTGGCPFRPYVSQSLRPIATQPAILPSRFSFLFLLLSLLGGTLGLRLLLPSSANHAYPFSAQSLIMCLCVVSSSSLWCLLPFFPAGCWPVWVLAGSLENGVCSLLHIGGCSIWIAISPQPRSNPRPATSPPQLRTAGFT